MKNLENEFYQKVRGFLLAYLRVEINPELSCGNQYRWIFLCGAHAYRCRHNSYPNSYFRIGKFEIKVLGENCSTAENIEPLTGQEINRERGCSLYISKSK